MATQHDAPAREQTTGGRFARPGAPERVAGGPASRSGRATAALILSILGCVFALFFALVGLILSVIGVILAGSADAGLELGIRAERVHTLWNGALECRLLRLHVSAETEKQMLHTGASARIAVRLSQLGYRLQVAARAAGRTSDRAGRPTAPRTS